jgi:hypothetical protein
MTEEPAGADHRVARLHRVQEIAAGRPPYVCPLSAIATTSISRMTGANPPTWSQ